MATTAAGARQDGAEGAELNRAGRTAAADLLAGGVEVGDSIPDVREQAFADGLLAGLHKGMANPPGWLRNILDGTRAVAASLNTEPEHGFVELIQNADDVGATVVRFALSADGKQILVVHNGSPVRPVNVLGMTLALVSTKVDDSETTGKFGIGLKTVLRFASSYEVHCAPYSFRVVNQTARQVRSRPAIRGLYAPEKSETLVALALLKDFHPDGLREWFKRFSADGLMFTRSVRRIELRGPSGRLLEAKELERGESATFRIRVADKRADVEHTEVRDTTSGTTWWRFSTKLPAPPTSGRSGKKTPDQVPFALAYTDESVACRLFAGMPLAVGGELPFHLNAMFDPNASRTDLLAGPWNEWILDRLTQFAAALALHRLEHDTCHAWSAIPLGAEIAGILNEWLAERLTQLVETVQDTVREKAQIRVRSSLGRLGDCRPEVEALEPLISDSEVERLTEAPTISRELRDSRSRWRTVLAELGITTWLNVDDALEVCDWDDLDRPGNWFVSLLNVALDEGGWAEHEARRRRCLLLGDGDRIAPQTAVGRGLLLGIATDGPKTLGAYLGLLWPVDAAFLADDEASKRVRAWLTDKIGLRTKSGDADALEALARREESDPIVLDKQGVLLLRDAFRQTPEGAGLGKAIGQRVLVDGFTYERGKRKDMPVRPGDAYLPPAIDTGKDSWAAAAGKTPGLKWIHPSFKNLLASGGGRGHGARDDPEEARLRRVAAARERSGAQSFFGDLGAETAPRLVARELDKSLYGEWAAMVPPRHLQPLQTAALADRSTAFLAFQNDHFSPDLIAVLEDISRAKVPDGRERARAVIHSLSRAWSRKYAPHEQAAAVHAYGSMTPLGQVPATWTAQAAEVRWMTNERGQRRKPSELAIRTAAFELVYGDAPTYYAFGLGPDDVEAGPVRAFGFSRQLRASRVIERLVELRADELSEKEADPDAVARCYRALSESAPAPGAAGRRLDDLKVSDVKKLFKAGSGVSTGLVRSSHGWKRPSEVLLGRPIFQDRASFVGIEAPRLWQLLDMRSPSLEDCLRILRDIAAAGTPSRRDEAILIDTYRYLVQLLATDQASRARSLTTAPVWTSEGWVQDRDTPVYAVADQALQLALGERLRVWLPKVRLGELGALAQAFRVITLDESSFGVLGINTGALAAGSDVQETIRSATAHLREWLALTDAELHERLANLRGLERSRAAVTQKLYVQITLPDGREEEVPRQAHVDRHAEHIMFVFADAGYVEDSDLMGRLLGDLVDADQREEVVLAHGWQIALDKVERDVELERLALAADVPDETSSQRKRRRSNVSGAGGKTDDQQPAAGGEKSKTTPPPRKLKRLDDITVEAEWASGRRPPKSAGRPKREKPRRKPDPNKPGPAGSGVGAMPWTPFERETLGLKLLERELGVKLKDIRNQIKVGADAIDQKNGVYYELKAHAGDMPDSVRLEPDEFKLARDAKEKFVLAAVSGLEDGYESRLLLFPDPLSRLRWEPNTALVITGLTTSQETAPAVAQATDATGLAVLE